jgi:Tfp pilus assembly protein PilO
MPVQLPRRSSWFVTLPIAATAIGFLSLVFFPTARLIRETRNEIRLKQDFIQQIPTLNTAIQQYEQQLNEIETYRREWESRMPSPDQLASLFGKINEETRESGSATTHFEPHVEKTMELLHRVPVKMDVVGSYPEICKLLAELEQMRESVWVDQLSLKRSRETGQNVEGELKLEVFTINSKKSG